MHIDNTEQSNTCSHIWQDTALREMKERLDAMATAARQAEEDRAPLQGDLEKVWGDENVWAGVRG